MLVGVSWPQKFAEIISVMTLYQKEYTFIVYGSTMHVATVQSWEYIGHYISSNARDRRFESGGKFKKNFFSDSVTLVIAI